MDYLMPSLEDYSPEKGEEIAEVGVVTKKKPGIFWILRSQSVANGMYQWVPPSSSSPLPTSSMSPRSHFECGGTELGSLVQSIGIASPENSASNFKTMPSELLGSTAGLQSKEKQNQGFASPHLSSKLKSGKHILRQRYHQTYIKPGQLRREWVNNHLSGSMGELHSQRKLCKALFQCEF